MLKPFEEVSTKLSAEHYPTASQIIIVIRGLTSVCDKFIKEDFHPTTIKLVQELKNGVSNRFHNWEWSKTLGLCTFLDPRFKLFGFSNPKAGDSIKSFVTELATKEMNRRRSNQVEEPDVSNIPATEKFSVWEDFDTVVATSQPRSTPMSGAIVEVQRYLDEPVIPRNEDPLKWWQKFQQIYPLLSEIVRARFSVVATSVPCERIFSKTGLIINDRRTRLTSKKVEQLIFLHENSE